MGRVRLGLIGGAAPARVSGWEGLATWSATLALEQSARLGRPIGPRALA